MSDRYGSDGRRQIDVPAASVINASGILAISAGTEIASTGTVLFADSNGFTWGLSSNTLTLSASLTAAANINISAGTTSNNLSAVTFADSNGLAFGLDASTITGSYTQSGQALSGSNGSFTFQTATFGNANGLSFLTSNGSMVGSYTVPTVTNSSWTASDSATSLTIARLAFTGSNGITMGLSTTTGGSATMTASYTVPTQSNQTGGIYGISNTTGQSSSSTYDLRSLSFEGAGIASVGWSNSSLIVSATQSNQALSGSNGSFAFQTATFGNTNGIDFYTTNGSLVATHSLQFTSNTSAITSNALNTSASRVINIIAATNNTGGGTASLSSNVSFSNANGATFYTSAGNAVALSYSVPTQTNQTLGVYISGRTFGADSSTTFDARSLSFFATQRAEIAISNGSVEIIADQGFSASIGTAAARDLPGLTLSNANNISFQFGAGVNSNKINASYEFDISAGTLSSGVNAVTFSDANGVFWGFDGSNVTANVGYLSYFQNQPWIVATNSQTHGNSTIGLVPFHMPLAGSFSYLRIPNSFSTNSTSISATTNANQGFSASILSTFFGVVYSQGVGANSRSLQFVASGSAGFSQQISVSVTSGSANARWSVSQKYTYPSEGFTTANTSYTVAQTSNTIGINTDSANSDFNFMRPLDIPFANSLSAGVYWLAIGRSSTTSTQSFNFLTGAKIDHSNVCATQANQAWGLLGQATASSVQLQKGIGSYTTNAMTTASIALSQISSSVSHLHPYFELHREA